MRRAARLAVGAACGLGAAMGAGCAHRASDGRPSEAELRLWIYHDDERLDVKSAAVALTQRLPWGDTASLEAGVDAVDVAPVDAVSSASRTTSKGGGLVEQRYDLAPGYAVALGTAAEPVDLSARGRVSREPDYTSWSVELASAAELFERNLALGAFVGFGHDLVEATSFADGDGARWPATHDRIYGGATLRQLLSRRVDLSAGVSLTWQSGELASPYRRAEVLLGQGFFARLVPEAETHPGERTRAVAFIGSAIYLGAGLGLHLRVAGYLDSWDVRALAPELMLDLELGPSGLLAIGYRFTAQGAASFFAETYAPDATYKSGDRRLGALDEHLTGLTLTWTVVGDAGARASLDVSAGWRLSLLTYRDVSPERTVLANEGTLGILWRY